MFQVCHETVIIYIHLHHMMVILWTVVGYVNHLIALNVKSCHYCAQTHYLLSYESCVKIHEI
jgi:uncharacterized membrane protein